MHTGEVLCYYFLKVRSSCPATSQPSPPFIEKNMPRRYILLIGIFLLLIVIGLGIFLSRASVLAAPNQPVAYSHKTHIDAGIQCLYCHSQATRSEIAGIPSMEKCMGCHNAIATEGEAIQEVIGYWDRNEPIPWEKVNRQPDYVYFSHQAHILSGLNCETCHGDVSNMDEARPVLKMDMGWCIECHLAQPEAKVGRIVDCLACHK